MSDPCVCDELAAARQEIVRLTEQLVNARAASQAAWRARRLALGLCTNCPAPLGPGREGKRFCEPCRKAMLVYSKSRYQARAGTVRKYACGLCGERGHNAATCAVGTV